MIYLIFVQNLARSLCESLNFFITFQPLKDPGLEAGKTGSVFNTIYNIIDLTMSPWEAFPRHYLKKELDGAWF